MMVQSEHLDGERHLKVHDYNRGDFTPIQIFQIYRRCFYDYFCILCYIAYSISELLWSTFWALKSPIVGLF
jgi:hypothetical protein